jgi:hypothetical protein
MAADPPSDPWFCRVCGVCHVVPSLARDHEAATEPD